MAIPIPASTVESSFKQTIFNAQQVVAGDPAITSAAYSMRIPVKSMALWIEYVPANPGNKLTVGVLLAPKGGATFVPPAEADFATNELTGSGVMTLCLIGCPDFEITLSSTGAGNDVATVILSGFSGCC